MQEEPECLLDFTCVLRLVRTTVQKAAMIPLVLVSREPENVDACVPAVCFCLQYCRFLSVGVREGKEACM